MVHKITLNTPVKVKLTDKAIQQWKEADDRIFPERLRKPLQHYKEKADQEGFFSFQLYELFRMFADEIYIGNDELPFGVEIILKNA